MPFGTEDMMPAYDENGNEINQALTMKETDKKCPMCGGKMDYDPTTKGLYCPFCEYKQEIENDEYAMEQDFEDAEATGNCDWGVETKVVICKSCGAQTVYDALQTSGTCPYCGSNQVMEAQAQNTLAPNGICPFEIDKQTASANFKRWLSKKLFAPSKAKKSAEADKFTGLYLPYWTFDADTYTRYTAKYGIDRTYTDSRGETHTTTDWYYTSGNYDRFIDDELVIATDRHENSMLRQIEPFYTDRSVQYKPEYIAGFVSERYSKGLADSWDTASAQIKQKLKSEIERKVLREHGADHVNIQSMVTDYSNKQYKYLILPVWLSSFRYNSKIYNFCVNGQTGKVGGRSPVSPIRVIIAILIFVAVLFLIYKLFGSS